MIATLALAGVLVAPAWGQTPEPPVLDPPVVEAEAQESAAELESRVEELSQQLAAQEAEIRRLRDQLYDQQSSAVLVHEEHLELDEELPVGPERVNFGGPVEVLAGEVISEAVSFGGDVKVAGHVTGDATAFGGSVDVVDGGRVDGDAVSFGGAVSVAPGGVVAGDRVGLGDHQPQITVTDTGKADIHHAGRGFLSSLYHRLVFLLSFLGAGVLLVGLFPDRVGRVAQTIEDRPLRSLMVGLFTTLALVFASVLFMITIVGIPIGVVLVAVLGLSWLAGFVGLCQALGDRLPFLAKPSGRWVTFLVGALIVSFVGVLPVVGWIAVGAASVLGMGAALTSRFGSPARV